MCAFCYLLVCAMCSPRLAVNMFSCDWFCPASQGPISTLWNKRFPSCLENDQISFIVFFVFLLCGLREPVPYFKKVIFIEQPSAAPTPVSRRIFWACSNVGALSSALVIKWRAKRGRNHRTFWIIFWEPCAMWTNYANVFFRYEVLWHSTCWWRKQVRDDYSSWCIQVSGRHSITMWISLQRP